MSIMLAPLPPAARALAELPRHQLELLAEIVVALLDATSPDPEREFDADGGCEAGDDGYYFQSRNILPGDSEDDEPDDPREEDDPPEFDNEDACEAEDDQGTGREAFEWRGEVIPFPGTRRP